MSTIITMVALWLQFGGLGNRLAGGATLSDGDVVIMGWNCENFYDYFDGGEGESDAEFSSHGAKRWTKKRFLLKCNAVAKTILWTGDEVGRLPDIIAFEEIENRRVLDRLLSETALRKLDYKVVHYESPDHRGIDCALLYRSSVLRLADSKACHVYEADSVMRTRDILVGQFVSAGDDSLAVMACHFPSKYGGEESDDKRVIVMNRLRFLADSLSRVGWRAQVALGDFNDELTSLPVSVIAPTFSVSEAAPAVPVSGAAPTAFVSGAAPTASVSGAAPTFSVSGDAPTVPVSGDAPTFSVPEAASTVPKVASTVPVSGAAPTVPVSGGASTFSVSGAAPTVPVSGGASTFSVPEVASTVPKVASTVPVSGAAPTVPVSGGASTVSVSGGAPTLMPVRRSEAPGQPPGSIRFNGKWELIDLVFASPSLFERMSFRVLRPPFLTERDATHGGEKPLRTYSGPRWLGGVSDHYPIVAVLKAKNVE